MEGLLRFDMPAVYQIEIQGELDSDMLGLIEPDESHLEHRGVNRITVLKMNIKDQAHLSGILNVLYDRRRTILRVEYAKFRSLGKN